MPRKTIQQKFLDKFHKSDFDDAEEYALSLIDYWEDNEETHDKEMNDVVKFAYTFYKRERKIKLNKLKNDFNKLKTQVRTNYKERVNSLNDSLKDVKSSLNELRQLKFIPRYLKSDYDILGVSQKASLQSIKAAYKKKALILHPDRGGNQEEFKKLSNAYQNILKSFTREN